MKNFLLIVSLLFSIHTFSQWSNTSNQFYDSLHMRVAFAAQSQRNPIVIKSYPDDGYFVIWEDDRNLASTKTDIYAQKYSKAGVALWAENGVPVANGPNIQRYTYSLNQDYRNRSYAATDSAGGFYIGYTDDSVSNYSYLRIAVQHMRSNGTPVFPGAGYIIAQTTAAQLDTYSSPMLIADGNRGFYISFSQNSPGRNALYVLCYKEEGGIMKQYGGGRVNDNAIQRYRLSTCGIQAYLDYPGTTIQDYSIWPDGQGGCNVIMCLNGNSGLQGKMLGFNRVWRAKKDSRTRTYYRNTSGSSCPSYTDYKKDEVYILNTLKINYIITTCSDINGVYVVTSERLRSNGFELIDQGDYDYYSSKGTTVFTNGNINVDAMAVTTRGFINNTVKDFMIYGYIRKVEKYDSIPYQLISSNDPDNANTGLEPALDKFPYFRDTLIFSSLISPYPDFTLSSGGVQIYCAALMGTYGSREVKVQSLQIGRPTTDSFSLTKETGKYGNVIGKEISTGFSGNSIYYDLPFISVDRNGVGLFSTREYYRGARVSPITTEARLLWGAMGRPISTGLINNSLYNLEDPIALIDASGGTGIITWRDNKQPVSNTNDNIYIRHLDSLDRFIYRPPVKPVSIVPNPFGATPTNPAILMGTSNQFSVLETRATIAGNTFETTVMEILDNFNLGRVEVNLFQNSGAIRSFNGQPYLNRNFTVKVENNPPPGTNITLRLFFTTQEFNALRTADNSINSPGDLVIIKQPNTTLVTPSTYVPIAGEQVIAPTAWSAAEGGFYLQFETSGFSNFFIQKAATIPLCTTGSSTITSNISGGSYQWQVNSGSGFTNIVSSANYSGVNTVTLQLTNIPSTLYGNQYRCLVSGNSSSVFSIRFSNTWNGSSGNSWETPANWSCGILPDANTDVFINSGAVQLGANASCRSIKVATGASVTVKPGFTLSVMK